MGNNDFWIGAGIAAGVTSLAAYGVWRFHEESYKKGWNGEELALVHFFGITGETRNGAWVLVPSYVRGRYDRELQLRLQILESKVEDLKAHVAQIEMEIQKLINTAVPPEEKEFLHGLLVMLKIKKGSPSQPHYTA